MELVNQTQSWIENIQHCVSYDSWTQFQHMVEGLRANWAHLSMLTWGCRPEKSHFVLQIIYIHLFENNYGKAVLPAFRKHLFELRCVEINIKESDVPEIRKWLLANNPDLWKMGFLREQSENA